MSYEILFVSRRNQHRLKMKSGYLVEGYSHVSLNIRVEIQSDIQPLDKTKNRICKSQGIVLQCHISSSLY